jgi:hypothetical protein
VIRQAISCDICGTEMQGTSHWFVAYDHKGEFRVSVWNARTRLRAGARHLCGHTCLHKLLDDFMARTLAVRIPAADSGSNSVSQKQQKIVRRAAVFTDTSLTAPCAVPIADPAPPNVDKFESSARLLAPPEIVPYAIVAKQSLRLLQVAAPQPTTSVDDAPIADTPIYSSRTWRAEAWKREREREERGAHHPSPSARHRSNA